MTESLRDKFMLEGFLNLVDILTKDEVDFYLKSFLAYEEKLGGNVKGAYRFKSHLLLPWMHRLVTHPKILEIVKTIFGPDILCWSTDLFPKDPGTGKICAWHQDATYIGMDPPDALTVWVALTDSNLENGCVQYSKGSHLKGQMEHKQTFDDQSMLLYGQEIPVDVEASTVHHAILRPGQASLHHIMTVHASGPNKSQPSFNNMLGRNIKFIVLKTKIGSGRRIGIAVRYCGAYIKQREGIGDSAMLVCGKDHGTFPLEPVPTHEFGPAEVEAHRTAVGAVGPQDLMDIK